MYHRWRTWWDEEGALRTKDEPNLRGFYKRSEPDEEPGFDFVKAGSRDNQIENMSAGRGASGYNQLQALPRIHYPKRSLASALNMSMVALSFSRNAVTLSRVSAVLPSRCI